MTYVLVGWLSRFMDYLERGYVFEALESISRPASSPAKNQQAHDRGE